MEQKIVQAAVAIKNGTQDCLYLGNIYSKRDIGHSEDFVRAMWLMLQQDEPDDYVVATGEAIMIKDLVDKVFSLLGMDLEWFGEGEDEFATTDARVVVRIDPKYYRPSEVDHLLGDSAKAREKLGWRPERDLDSLLEEMVSVEEKRISRT